MKKAKIILTCVAILAVIGGALAFKANKFAPRNVYSLLPGNKIHTQLIGTIVYQTTVPNCTFTAFRLNPAGQERSDVSTLTTSPLSVTVFTSAGHPNVTTTWPYCTAAILTVAASDDQP